MRLYRICHVRYLEDLRGLGASYRDGARWNEPGVSDRLFRRDTERRDAGDGPTTCRLRVWCHPVTGWVSTR